MAAKKTRKVPAARGSRLAKMAGLAGGLAGGMLAEGARRLAAGERPKAQDMLLTPSNARRVADQLANMRGAAMKLGQLLSMDTGDLLPPEWTEVLARLRSDADAMPASQLESQLEAAYGDEWPEILYDFNYRPVAAASIGQVHRAIGPGGVPMALKVQYPGIAQSIDSDVDNLAQLLKVSGVLPKDIDLGPIFEELKAQLHDEANYLVEAEYQRRWYERLKNDERFLVPAVFDELCREFVLPMEFVEAQAIESVAKASQAERDRVMAALVELMFTELFDWREVQTDPNYANYLYQPDLYQPEKGRIVLLDFGATRRFKASFVNHYKSLAKAAIKGDQKRLLNAAIKLGYLTEDVDEEMTEMLLDIFNTGAEPMLIDADYDFGASDMAARMQAKGMELQDAIAEKGGAWHNPPVDALYFHRKVGGLFMLAARLGAKINVHRLITAHL